jgi:hypothetical protein
MINSLGQVVYFKELSFRSYELGIEKTELGIMNEELGIKKTELGIMNEELGIIIQVKTVKGTFYQKIISN